MLVLQTLWLPLVLLGIVLIIISGILGAGRSEIENQHRLEEDQPTD
jgi:hypothetical protein